MAKIYQLELDDNEVKMLIAALRQVRHTFFIAEQQSQAAGEPLAADYHSLQEQYERLHAKLTEMLSAAPDKPFRVK